MMTNSINTKNIVLVWDLPIRVIHWLLFICFTGAYLTAEEDGLRLLHVTLGYTLAALMAVRFVWGFVGTKHARFSSFIKGPEAAWLYLMSLFKSTPQHHTGHNPLGAIAILGLMLLSLGVSFTGWCALHEVGGEWNEELHETIAEGMLFLVVIHVVSVLIASLLHRENLVRAMVNGTKSASPSDRPVHQHLWAAILVVLSVIGFWSYQYTHAAVGGIDGAAIVSYHNLKEPEDDD